MTLGLSLALLTACGSSEPEPPAVAQMKACLEQSAAMPAAADGDDQFLCAVPIFAVDDLQASLRHYRDVLGFQVAWEWGNPATFAGVRRGHVDVYFCEQCQGRAGTYMSILVRDVDEVWREYLDRGAKILRPPKDEEWGLREMWVEDLDGHVLRVGNGTH